MTGVISSLPKNPRPVAIGRESVIRKNIGFSKKKLFFLRTTRAMSSLRNKLHNLVSDVKEAKAALHAHNVEPYHEPPPPPHPPSNTHALPPPLAAHPTATSTPAKDEEHSLAPPVKKEEKGKGVRPPTPPPPPRNLPHGWTARFDVKEGKFAYSRGVDGVEQWELRTFLHSS